MRDGLATGNAGNRRNFNQREAGILSRTVNEGYSVLNPEGHLKRMEVWIDWQNALLPFRVENCIALAVNLCAARFAHRLWSLYS